MNLESGFDQGESWTPACGPILIIVVTTISDRKQPLNDTLDVI